jgi:hypothetical protein
MTLTSEHVCRKSGVWTLIQDQQMPPGGGGGRPAPPRRGRATAPSSPPSPSAKKNSLPPGGGRGAARDSRVKPAAGAAGRGCSALGGRGAHIALRRLFWESGIRGAYGNGSFACAANTRCYLRRGVSGDCISTWGLRWGSSSVCGPGGFSPGLGASLAGVPRRPGDHCLSHSVGAWQS